MFIVWPRHQRPRWPETGWRCRPLYHLPTIFSGNSERGDAQPDVDEFIEPPERIVLPVVAVLHPPDERELEGDSRQAGVGRVQELAEGTSSGLPRPSWWTPCRRCRTTTRASTMPPGRTTVLRLRTVTAWHSGRLGCFEPNLPRRLKHPSTACVSTKSSAKTFPSSR